MSLLREFVADHMALPEVQLFLKWWWLQLALLGGAFVVMLWATRDRR